jgi:glycosyltransferase involved in cell wall biosynthesis
MDRQDTLRLRPLHDLHEDGAGRWIAGGHDPQFLVEGPFARGLWELRIRGAAPQGSSHAAMQLYYAERGDFTESFSVRARGLDAVDSERRLRFWLPFRAAALRFDPSTEPGPVTIQSVRLVRLNPVVAFVTRWMALARLDPREAFRRLRQIASAWRTERRRAKALILELVSMGADADRDSYRTWLKSRCAGRAAEYPFTPEAGLFSLLTTVYDTPPEYIHALARSVAAQAYRQFEWIVLDNGSTAAATRAAIDRLAADPRVRQFRVERNLGIIGGMRYVLERAGGRYVLPVDSDDVLFPDALAAVASRAQRHRYPALLYTDEDKLLDDRHTDPFLKPDWDPVFLRNCCYVAHLTAIDRLEALRLGAYTDAQAEGCHDWDTFFRFVRHGHTAAHVPDILYSWRMHARSTAADVTAKDYIIASQRHVLGTHLATTGLDDRLEVVRSPHFPASPDWWMRRRRANAPRFPLVIRVVPGGVAASLAILDRTGSYPVSEVWLISAAVADQSLDETAASLRRAKPDLRIQAEPAGLPAVLGRAAHGGELLVAIADGSVEPRTDEWLWEVIGLKEAFPDAVLIGGRVLDRAGRVVAGAQVFGYAGWIGSPDAGRAAADPGYFGSALKQRSASAVDGRLCAVDPRFVHVLAGAGETPPDSIDALGPWLGVRALERGARVIFSPFVEATTDRRPGAPQPLELINAPADTRYYHRLLSRTRAFQPGGIEAWPPRQ